MSPVIWPSPIDDYTIKLHLDTPNIGVPEHLFNTPAVIVPSTFEGDFVQQPLGTGPFLLTEYAEGERARLVRREDYWRMGADGSPLPYLDEIVFVSLDRDAAVAAVQSGQADSLSQPRPADWLALKDMPEFTVRSASTGKCFILRMRTDLEPWNDVRVRNALKMCQDRAKILQLSYFGEGDLSIDAHMAPVHPAYCEQPIPEYNPERAKQLLVEAGYPDGLQVTIVSKNDEAEPEIAQALKELAAPAGFDITLDLTEPSGYWDRWWDVPLGISRWQHRSLGTTLLTLGYGVNIDGTPTSWNETRWVDDEFNAKVKEAERTLDVAARREIMCDLQTIMAERGGIGNSYWAKVWNIARSEFKNIEAHPVNYYMFHEVWKDA